MGLLGRVFLLRPRQLLRDDQLGDVDAIAEQIGDRLLRVFDGGVRVSLDEDQVQASVDEIGDKRAIVPSHRLDSLAIHLVVLVCLSEVQPGVTLLVDQKVWKVNLQKCEVIRDFLLQSSGAIQK